MPQPTKGPRLGGSPAHQRLILSNLATALFEHGAITTTQAKAKRLRPLAERMVTFAKKGDLAARRQVLTVVRDKDVVYRLFSEIAPTYTERAGGYTRITKLMPRKGDNAPMARIELVEGATVAQEAVGEAERARGTRFSRRGGAELPVAATPVEEPGQPTPGTDPPESGTPATPGTAAPETDGTEYAEETVEAGGLDAAPEGDIAQAEEDPSVETAEAAESAVPADSATGRGAVAAPADTEGSSAQTAAAADEKPAEG